MPCAVVHPMNIEGKPRSAERGLVNAEGALREGADAHPFLEGHGRAFRRIARVANRPPRIAILGETNSGKSSLANLLAGIWALPTHPVETTRLPGLLKYAPALSVTAVRGNGERIEIPLGGNIAEAVDAHRYDGGLSRDGSGGPAGIEYIELGLPSALLRSVEIVDFPAGRMDVAGLGMDAAIWTTVATQAWRESERARWLEVPPAVRARSLLAVTFCDLIAGEKDRKKLRARLETTAKQYFQDICFIANGDEKPSTAASANTVLFARVQDLARDFAAQRQAKATAIARRVAKYRFEKRDNAEREAAAAIARKFAPEAGTGLFPADRAAGLNSPVLEAGLEKPPITPGRPGAAAKPPGREPAVAPHSSAPGQSSKRRSANITIGLLLLAGFAAAVAFQFGLVGTGKVAVSNSAPGASEAGGQASPESRGKAEAEAAAAEARRKAEATAAEARRQAEAEAAAAEARRKAEAEAAAVEVRRKAEAEAAAVEARGKAEAEAAAVEARGKAEAEAAAAEVRRKAEAEAAAVEVRRKAEAEAAAARRKAEAEATAAEARRKAEAAAAEAERRRRATPQQAPYRPGGNNIIIHGE